MPKPKILLIDIETRPMLSYIWSLFDEQGGTAMLHSDSSILSWSAKWHDPEGKVKYPVMYADQRNAKDIENEKPILEKMAKLLDEADIVIGHNLDAFDVKRLNARFVQHEIDKPSDYRTIDTLKIAKRYFKFTSNKLEYLAHALKCQAKKLVKRKFPGFELWKECLAGNKEAWKEMEVYNKQDVIVLEEVYIKLIKWDDKINFSVYYEEDKVCSCGSTKFIKKGTTSATNTGIFQRYKCKGCGKPSKGKENLLSKEKRKAMRK